MRRILMATAASLDLASLMASAAQAQQSSSTITTYQTPAGPVTHSQMVMPSGNGTVTVNNVSPGNNTSVQPSVGAVTYSSGNSQPQTTYTVGVSIPLGSTPATSTSTAPPATSNPQ
jgi:hypothetical protein